MAAVAMTKPKTRLLLIMPPQPGLLGGFATGLVSLANYVSRRAPSIDTEVLDLSASSLSDSREQVHASFSGGINDLVFVGITTTTASYQSALRVAEIAKGVAPRCVVVFGGHHASADAEHVLRKHIGGVDIVIAGEGERSLAELLREYPNVERVHGAVYLRDGSLVRNPSPGFLTQDELDSLPVTFEKHRLVGIPGKFDHVTYVSARGCPLRCSFCSVGDERIRPKSIPAILRDLNQLLEAGFRRIAIEDNFFAHSPARTRDLCLAIAEFRHTHNGAFTWDCQTRVESIARSNTVRLLAKAGCEAVYIGVESLHAEHLRYLGKTANPADYIEQLNQLVIPRLLDSPVECYLNLQFGLPGESQAHERRTIEILADLGSKAASKGRTITLFPQLHVVYPGTRHFQDGLAQGLFPGDVFESFTAWEFEQAPVRFWLGEHFAHGTGGLPVGILNGPALKTGRYEVDADAILRISGTLKAISRLPGITTFHFGNYLIKNNPPVAAQRGVDGGAQPA
ncbi:MAG: radical SAM protein [Planctomycetota bacterium]|nr:radical SAM protein [Planctomycetota bacterium]